MPISRPRAPRNEGSRVSCRCQCAGADRLRGRAAARSGHARSGVAGRVPVCARSFSQRIAGGADAGRGSGVRYAGGAGAGLLADAGRSGRTRRGSARRGGSRGRRAAAGDRRERLGHRAAQQSRLFRRGAAGGNFLRHRAGVLRCECHCSLGSRPVRPAARAGARRAGTLRCRQCARPRGADRAAGGNRGKRDRLAHT